CATAQSGVAFADDDNKVYVTFCIDEDTIYEKVEVVDGYYSVPENDPTLEGYTFCGWSDGFTFLDDDKSYYTSSDSLVISATWQEDTDEISYDSLTADWFLPVAITVGVIMLSIFAFFYYWCVVRDTKLTNIIPTIKASIAEKRKK
ncbi:MAG: hypothetical protein R3Y23_01910, partial [Bacillota bacterium]